MSHPKKPAADLKDLAFPQCTMECAVVAETRTCACEVTCPFKFRKCTGKPYLFENLSQMELDQYHAKQRQAGRSEQRAGQHPAQVPGREETRGRDQAPL